MVASGPTARPVARAANAGAPDTELDQVRLASETLHGLIRLVASSPDLDRVLEGVVEVLTKATRCHACFVYLRRGDRLRLRGASQLYAQLVGQVEFGIDEGLAGWVLRRNTPAFIRDRATDDPRTNLVCELGDESLQSMVAVPIPARGGGSIGVIVLNTIAPRTFDDGTLSLLSHAAALLAGAIENAQLHEEARRRIAALTALSSLSQRIAAAEGREALYATATAGVRTLLGVRAVRLYETDPGSQRLQLVAAAPPMVDLSVASPPSGPEILLELLQHQRRRDGATNIRLQAALGLEQSGERVLAAPVTAGIQHLGVLVALGGGGRATTEEAEELMRATANQLAVALRQKSLIERLAEEDIVRDLFAALESGSVVDAEARAHRARYDLGREHVMVHVERCRGAADGDSWAAITERAELALRDLGSGALHVATGDQLRVLLALATGGHDRELRALDERLDDLGRTEQIVVGRSDVISGAAGAVDGLTQAADAAKVARALCPAGGALPYSQLGAYRYLVHLADSASRTDPYLKAVRILAAYDRRRGSQLVLTLEQYLAERRSATEAGRALSVHRNTVRQRLERIESLSGVDLANIDLLALELAVKLIRLNPDGWSPG